MLDYSNYIKTGLSKINNKWYKTIILGIMAGFFIALAGFASTIVSYTIANPSLAKLLSGCIFPIGLILVVLFQTELFTGNSLLSILTFKKDIKVPQMLKNWLIVYISNFIGAIIFSILLYYSGLINNDLKNVIVAVALKKSSLTFIKALILGMLCNMLVCIAVFLSSNGKSAGEKILLIFIPIMAFIILGFEHSVANMYFLSIGKMLSNEVTFSGILINLIPVTFGNIVGGLIISLYIYFMNRSIS